jgi:hypothetical protein
MHKENLKPHFRSMGSTLTRGPETVRTVSRRIAPRMTPRPSTCSHPVSIVVNLDDRPKARYTVREESGLAVAPAAHRLFWPGLFWIMLSAPIFGQEQHLANANFRFQYGSAAAFGKLRAAVWLPI